MLENETSKAPYMIKKGLPKLKDDYKRKRPALEKAKQLQAEKDIQEKEAKRLALENAQIEAFIEKNINHIHQKHLMR